MKLAIIADDLTGAMDAAAPFADRGLSVRVILQLAMPGDGTDDVVALDTASRDSPPAEAARIVAQCVAALPAGTPLFKKIDSTLRGPTIDEIRAAAFGRSRVIVAPAVPEQGRIVRGGTVFLRDVPIEGVDGEIFARRLASALAPLPCEMADCATDEELEGIARAAPADALLVGAAGLARALAQVHFGNPASSEPPAGAWPLLVVAGSQTEITTRQIACFREGRPEVEILLPLATRAPTDRNAVAAELAERTARRMRDACFGALLLTGGHTARAVLDRLAVSTLRARGHLAPGIPWSEAEIGARPVLVATKAGGFGAPDTLLAIAERLGLRSPG